ncbi:MAG: outer membrane protein [Pseudomonadota bacterium]
MRSTARVMKTLPAALIATGLLAGAASAADLLIDPPVIEAPEIKSSGGWYLRGDISYDFSSFDKPHYNVGGAGGVVPFETGSVEDSFNIGLGIGYQINEYFRVDLTGDYVFSSKFEGSTTGVCPDPDTTDAFPGSPCASEDHSDVTKFKLLANAYVDLGHYGGFTPYVGAGLGGAYVSWDSLSNTSNCTTGDPLVYSACPGVPEGYTATGTGSTRTDIHEGGSSWRFAYALHAGTSYNLTHNTKLDIGYTYSRIEGGEMFDWLDGSGTQGYDKGFDEHIIRAGLRYQFN